MVVVVVVVIEVGGVLQHDYAGQRRRRVLRKSARVLCSTDDLGGAGKHGRSLESACIFGRSGCCACWVLLCIHLGTGDIYQYTLYST